MESWDANVASAHWKVGDTLPPHNDFCSVCGEQAAASPLVAPFSVLEAQRVGTQVRFDERHQGAPAYAHGGAVAAVLDDAMGYVSFLVLRIFVTANLSVDYRRPVHLGATYDVVAWCEQIDGRKLSLAAELRDADGIVAEARGLFVSVDLDHFRP